MPLVLVPRTDASGPLSIDASGLAPDRVTSMTAEAVARLPLVADCRPCPLGDLFQVSGHASDGVIECRGDFSRVHFLAAGMQSGTVRVRGDAGRHAGEGMTGGRLEIAGSAGDWLAADMTGGEVMVSGNVGDNVASALPGSPMGMRGGVVVVHGSAGALAGSRLRRGLIAIAGHCDAAPGFEMLAGTLVVAGRVGRDPGLGMRRGSIVSLTHGSSPPATFTRGAAWRPSFLPLLLTRLGERGFRPAAAALKVTAWRQWHGDGLAGGRGELLQPDP